jgi:mannose/fructose/N-acetylgalactosamine-specific phosphotransferase system component IIC
MMLSPGQTAAAAVLGGLLALDGTSVAQLMVSRPFVAAALGGAIVGNPGLGMAAGVVLEALHLAVLPVGAARYPEGGPAAVAAGSVYAAHDPSSSAAAALLIAVLCALALEWVGGRSVAALRQVNVRFAGAPADGLTPGGLARRHGTPIALDFLRGALLTLAGVLGLGALLALADLSGFPDVAAGTVVRLAAVAGIASALRLFGRANYPLFLAGGAAGALVAWLR